MTSKPCPPNCKCGKHNRTHEHNFRIGEAVSRTMQAKKAVPQNWSYDTRKQIDALAVIMYGNWRLAEVIYQAGYRRVCAPTDRKW